jgi:hypothetical protein
MSTIRKFFSPGTGSRARNIARAVLPVLVLLGVVDLDATQLAAIVVAVEVVFSGGAELATRNEGA